MAKIRDVQHVKRTYSISEVADLLGVGRNGAYAAAGKDFPVITIGKRKVVPKAAIDRLLERQRTDGHLKREKPRRRTGVSSIFKGT